MLYEDGVPVAALVSNKPQFLLEADGATQQRWRNALLRRPAARRRGSAWRCEGMVG